MDLTDDTAKLSLDLSGQSPEYFVTKAKEQALKLFHDMAARVPAYGAFLQAHSIAPNTIRSYQDLAKVPAMDKQNYLTQYSLAELSWDGKIDAHMFSTSSGASGTPHFWPRGQRLEDETAQVYELLFKHFFELDTKRTLVINAYSMGMYVAGTFTLNSCMRIAAKGYPLTVITPGINAADAVTIVEQIGHNFDQIVLCAYPPLAKDIIDQGIDRGVKWKNYHLRFISGGESYTEKWRAYLYRAAGVPKNRYFTSSVNTYGSADAAILGHETPLSILIRTYASRNKGLCQELFGRETVPSFHQYYPFYKDVSVENGELCFTANAGIPLLRYNIHDAGGVWGYAEIMKVLAKHGISQEDIAAALPAHLIWKLPFVYLYGRSNAGTTFYGLNLYPENIRAGLEDETVFPYVSGKFTLSTEQNRSMNQFIRVTIELRANAKPDKRTLLNIRKVIYEKMRETNGEFRMLSQTFPRHARPRIRFSKHGDQRYFPTRIKEQYVKK